jgi:hypothetical protein
MLNNIFGVNTLFCRLRFRLWGRRRGEFGRGQRVGRRARGGMDRRMRVEGERNRENTVVLGNSTDCGSRKLCGTAFSGDIHRLRALGVGVRRLGRVDCGSVDELSLPCRIRQIQFIQAIGGGDFELQTGVERPIDDIAFPKVELNPLRNMEQRELDRRPVKVHVVRQVPRRSRR